MIRISLCFDPARGGDGPVRPIAPLSATAVRELTQLLNHELNLTPSIAASPSGRTPGSGSCSNRSDRRRTPTRRSSAIHPSTSTNSSRPC